MTPNSSRLFQEQEHDKTISRTSSRAFKSCNASVMPVGDLSKSGSQGHRSRGHDRWSTKSRSTGPASAVSKDKHQGLKTLQSIFHACWILVKEWFQRTQLLLQTSCELPKRDSTAKAQKANRKERLLPTLSRRIAMRPSSGPSQAAARSAPAGSVASHNAGSRSEPLSAGGGVRSEVEEVGDESDGGDE